MNTHKEVHKYLKGEEISNLYPGGILDILVHSEKELENGLEHNYSKLGHFFNEDPAPDNGKAEVVEEVVEDIVTH
jgi:hypothetical protein